MACYNVYAGQTVSLTENVLLQCTYDMMLVVRQDWRDDRLVWNVEDFDVLNVVMHPDRIWLPELTLMNGFVTSLHHPSSTSLA